MKIENELTLPVPPEQAWPILLDLERIAPCLPGAAITGRDGDVYQGKSKIKVGPITAEYKGVAEFVEVDEAGRRAVIRASGRDSRGQGNVSATVQARLVPDPVGSKVLVETELDITGKVAQFGRGVINDAATVILETFAERLGAVMTAGTDQGAAAPAATAAPGAADPAVVPAAVVASQPVPAFDDDAPLDLLKVAKQARAQKKERSDSELVAWVPAIVAGVSAVVSVFAAGFVVGRTRS